MVDINLGNKTLTVGVAIALILSYGMVNFDTGSRSGLAFPTVEAVSRPLPAAAPAAPAVAQPTAETANATAAATETDAGEVDTASLPAIQQDVLETVEAPTNYHEAKILMKQQRKGATE